jgi:metal-responsive CopG/Arc/MetJ family transcriptional regulator
MNMSKVKPEPIPSNRMVTYVRFSAATIEKLDALAMEEETNRSTVIRSIVLKALKEAAQKEREAA